MFIRDEQVLTKRALKYFIGLLSIFTFNSVSMLVLSSPVHAHSLLKICRGKLPLQNNRRQPYPNTRLNEPLYITVWEVGKRDERTGRRTHTYIDDFRLERPGDCGSPIDNTDHSGDRQIKYYISKSAQ